MGWSRSGYVVRYTLTHSSRPFAAAVIADGYDDGYFYYLSRLPLGAAEAHEHEGIIGAAPFGVGEKTGLSAPPGPTSTACKPRCAYSASRPGSLFFNWEWFAGLQRLGKPVEFAWLPNAGHDPELPSDRIVAQDGDVDWFQFWLQGREDPSPAKHAQYVRWERLRSQAAP